MHMPTTTQGRKLQEEGIKEPLVFLGRPPVPRLGNSVRLPQLLSRSLCGHVPYNHRRARTPQLAQEASEEGEHEKHREVKVQRHPNGRLSLDGH